MSKIDELIAKLCPDGVEYRELGSLLSYEQPTKYLVSSTAYSDDYETPVLTAGKTFILGYTNDEEGIYPSSPEAPVIIFDDFTTDFKWVDFPFKAKSSAMKMLHANGPQWNLRYVFHAMQTLSFVPQGHKRHWIGVYSHLEIPVPPMEIQKEIVKVLDSFITLEAELEARKAQYRYYRNQLLSFERERESPMAKARRLLLSNLLGSDAEQEEPRLLPRRDHSMAPDSGSPLCRHNKHQRKNLRAGA